MLTAKQKRFVEEYLVDLNATQAAIRSGYSAKTAYSIGDEILKKPEVAAEIDAAMIKRSERTAITADNVLKELAKIGFSDVRKMFSPGGSLLPVTDMDDAAAACIASIEIVTRKARGGDDDEVENVSKVRLWDKRAALVDVGKHLGMFRERVELTGKDGNPIEMIDQTRTDADAFTRTVASIASRTRAGSGAGKTQH